MPLIQNFTLEIAEELLSKKPSLALKIKEAQG